MKRVDVVAAIIIRDGRVLLTQRKRGKPFAHRWCIPGGGVEEGESHEVALGRECREEVNATIERPTLADVEPVIVDLGGGRSVEVFYYIAPLAEDSHEPRPMEGQGFGWFTADDLERLELTPADEARRDELVKLVRGATT